ncbi:MAG TPA: cytochrome P450 [Candidatus Dormibacteraeota bacterium]|jgi:cytochrome P450
MSARVYDEVDISSTAFWSQPPEQRERSFAVLRRERPVSWHRPAEGGLVPQDSVDPGYWAVVRHEDVVAVSRNAQTFCSGRGVMFEDIPEEINEAATSFLAMDAPRHATLRRLVASAFTVRQVARIEERIRVLARALVTELAPLGECDLVAQVSERLPVLTLSEMLGVAPADRELVARAANDMVGWNDPELVGGREPIELTYEALLSLLGVALRMAEERRRRPGDDLMTALVQAEVEGDRLTDEEVGAFFVLLNVAGNDTTRHTISHGVRLLTEHPEQRRRLMDDFGDRIDGAVDEILRWSTPVMTFRRTVTRDAELRGQRIAEGDKVVLFYSAANRDARAFDHPERFDILRHPNPHVGFGGGGPHFCLGFSLARAELRAIFDEMLHRVPDIEAGPPQYLGGNFMNGIKRLPVRFTPTGPRG